MKFKIPKFSRLSQQVPVISQQVLSLKAKWPSFKNNLTIRLLYLFYNSFKKILIESFPDIYSQRDNLIVADRGF